MTLKSCAKCGKEKPLDEFYRDKTQRDGRKSRCKVCEAEDNRRYYEANREKELGRMGSYYEANRDKILEQHRRYQESNGEAIREMRAKHNRRFYEENREYMDCRSQKTISKYQESSLKTAWNRGNPWSEEDDLVILYGVETNFEKAVKLGRTYLSVASRRRTLKKQKEQAA